MVVMTHFMDALSGKWERLPENINVGEERFVGNVIAREGQAWTTQMCAGLVPVDSWVPSGAFAMLPFQLLTPSIDDEVCRRFMFADIEHTFEAMIFIKCPEDLIETVKAMVIGGLSRWKSPIVAQEPTPIYIPAAAAIEVALNSMAFHQGTNTYQYSKVTDPHGINVFLGLLAAFDKGIWGRVIAEMQKLHGESIVCVAPAVLVVHRSTLSPGSLEFALFAYVLAMFKNLKTTSTGEIWLARRKTAFEISCGDKKITFNGLLGLLEGAKDAFTHMVDIRNFICKELMACKRAGTAIGKQLSDFLEYADLKTADMTWKFLTNPEKVTGHWSSLVRNCKPFVDWYKPLSGDKYAALSRPEEAARMRTREYHDLSRLALKFFHMRNQYLTMRLQSDKEEDLSDLNALCKPVTMTDVLVTKANEVMKVLGIDDLPESYGKCDQPTEMSLLLRQLVNAQPRGRVAKTMDQLEADLARASRIAEEADAHLAIATANARASPEDIAVQGRLRSAQSMAESKRLRVERVNRRIAEFDEDDE